MKIFVDTNIFLDILFERENYKASLSILKAVKNTLFEGVVADITIVNIDYISRKVEADICAYLQMIEKHFSIVGADNNIIKKALALKNKDIEDNIQYSLALNKNCDCIITNDKGFYAGDIEVFSNVEFFEKYIL